ncbi:undecaprenyl-diphosphate phosphatase [Candidatus Mycosynbacter amalyticus]|uniref:Undecaprenyl-diphosphatase n=1 Tax=Candidatus Mycosynbacter amalyticus TaxID=2665156 RepID=A0A857MJ06_9BACT|nr:undecaprenyl-diphosphate phosphatase [Candidatus Mycosynbacter amalyticus]QHN42536.1 undecaprenyl-diphosphate phosphatase [Candidatus Mycosynbacter amalyticus]
MEWWHAIVFGVIEGVTEFLPVSSTGHLTIMEKLLGYQIDDPSVTAFTAIIQVGAVLATVLYLRKDIWRVGVAWLRGLAHGGQRKHDYKFGWAVLIGSVPIGIVGFLFKDEIEGVLRSLWFVAGALILWSVVMWFADKAALQNRHEKDTTWKDTLVIGLTQCLALIPGVSRSGATMSAGLLRGFDRVTVTRLSFFLSIPALMAAAVLQTVTQYDEIQHGVGWGPTLLATAVSFVVAWWAVAWLLKFIAKHDYSIFIWYRVGLGVLLIVLLTTGVVSPV